MDDGRSLFDLFHTEWTLLVLGSDETAHGAFIDAARALHIDLKVVRLPTDALRSLYEAPLALIRPDQIVAWRGASSEAAHSILAKVAGRQ